MTTMERPQTKAVDDYLRLPYTVRVVQDPTGGYVVDVEEFPGCVTQAETWQDAGGLIMDAMRDWIAFHLEDGLPIPEPKEEVPPAKMLTRLPRSLHEALVRAAAHDGVSLNQFVVYQLGRALGMAEGASGVQ
jgi:antitoxin HicB